MRYFFFEDDFFDDDDFFEVEAFFELVPFFDDDDFFEVAFFEVAFFDDDFFEEPPAFFDDDFGAAGTLPPSRLASDRPMAMACLRLVTFLPEPPLRSVPAFLSCIVFSTLSCAFFPYRLAIEKTSCTTCCASQLPVMMEVGARTIVARRFTRTSRRCVPGFIPPGNFNSSS